MNKIREALNYLDGGARWHKGGLSDGDNRCLIGALMMVDGDDYAIESVVEDVVLEQYADRINVIDNCLRPVAQFNDHPDTTWPEAERVMEKAAMKLDEEVR